MYTTLIVLIIIASALMITAMILLLKCISENEEMLKNYYTKLEEDIRTGISDISDLTQLVDYAVSRLPKSRSKKLKSDIDETDDIIKDIEPSNDHSND